MDYNAKKSIIQNKVSLSLGRKERRGRERISQNVTG
jgi:hypothetical protein